MSLRPSEQSNGAERLLLERVEDSGRVTLGHLYLPDGRVLWTLEPPWKNNERRISCIPGGMYLCKPFYSPIYGLTWKLQNVPERDDIEFHWGNFAKDTKGCILVGLEQNGDAIFKSRLAMEKLVRSLSDRGILDFTLIIKYAKTFERREKEERDGCPAEGSRAGDTSRVPEEGQKTSEAKRNATRF